MPDSVASQVQSGSQNSPVYKRVEIEQSESPVTAISEKVSPSIVGIRVTSTTRDFLFGLTQGTGEGSGIIIREDGYIMTNYHVIQNALNTNYRGAVNNAKIEVFLPNKKDTPYTASVVGHDYRTDLAVIKIDATNLPAAELGDSDKLKVGELAVAIGNPGGLEYMGSVTVGVISGLNRTIKNESGNDLKLIQTDAAINPGNSGGALVNSKGQVIGVNSVKVIAQGFEGLGFAIPINEAVKITDSLIEYTYVKGRPFFGIRPDPLFNKAMAERYNVPEGVLVQEVLPFTGAYRAGIKAGDIITKFDGQKVTSLDELNRIKNKHKPGDIIPVEIYRNNETRTINVELTEEQN
jgi:serine protease Do